MKYELVPYTRGNGLEISNATEPLYPHFTLASGLPNAEKLSDLFKPASLDFVYADYTDGDPEEFIEKVRDCLTLIKPDGHLCVSYLDPLFSKNSFNADAIEAVAGHGFSKKCVLPYNAEDGLHTLLVFGRWENGENGNPADKTACVVRYGAFGDMMQAAALLPELKRQGYHVTMMTTPKGQNILREDPHIDAWLIQDDAQVENADLAQYWEHWAARFDRFINLSETVEGSLLAIPGRVNHAWPDAMRRKYLNHNYLEFMADVAGIPHNPAVSFYPTAEEEEFAKDFIKYAWHRADTPYVIVWVLAGSSVHKSYPMMDEAIAQTLKAIPEALIVMVGDYSCKLLEQGWETNRRVIRASGDMSIRETLALALESDCVFGPETGVLNAVGFEPAIHKVVMLSHSSKNNLTRDWVNTTTIEPDVPCYPCHRLHYNRDFCPEHIQSGCALCAASIPPESVSEAIRSEYESRRTENSVSQ